MPLLGSWAGATAGLLCGFAGVQIALLTNPVYQLPGGGINFWLVLGLAYATSRIDAAGGRDEARAVPPEGSSQRRALTGPADEGRDEPLLDGPALGTGTFGKLSAAVMSASNGAGRSSPGKPCKGIHDG